MEAAGLDADSFSQYPKQGAALAISHLQTLRSIPLALLPVLLLQFKRYDSSFPAEQKQLAAELERLASLSPAASAALMQPFAAIAPPPSLRNFDWLHHPQEFTERLTSWLWSQHKIDSYHAAAEEYRAAVHVDMPAPDTPRWTAVLIGRESSLPARPVFRKLGPHGTIFTSVDPHGGTDMILGAALDRAAKIPVPFGHWYIDGGDLLPAPGLTTTGYNRLIPAARKEFHLLREFSSKLPHGDPGVESATSYVASLTPEMLGISGDSSDPLRSFEVNILTQGAGCQIFSTSFVQWAARECLHRAQPITLVTRYASRQASAPLEQLLNRDPLLQPKDHAGSLVDSDMGAYYTWINQGRLPGSERSRFLAWWEDHNLAVVISPGIPRGTTSYVKCSIQEILTWMA